MPNDYETPLAKWDSASTVRRSPRREVGQDGSSQGFFFPPTLEPISLHPDVASLGPLAKQEILIHRLYQYIDFTVELEQFAVNPALLMIAHSQLNLDVSDEMSFDAHKIYCDEAYHAFFSADLKRQVAGVTGVRPRIPSKSRLICELERILENWSPELVALEKLGFAFVSETLISKTLGQIPGDSTVVPAIREVMADHAKDERVHHAYFAKLIEIIWPQLSRGEQAHLGPLFPKFIKAFLEPDKAALVHILPKEIAEHARRELVEWCYPEAAVSRSVRESSKASVGLLRKVGALDHSQTQEAFEEAGLLLF